MRAVRFHTYGGPEVLEIDEVERHPVGPGEVLVQVRACSVNPIDWMFREGELKWFMPKTLPVIPGADLAGEVAEVGEGVDGFAVGDRVVALMDGDTGAQAEWVAVPVDAVAHLPDALPFVEGVSIVATGLTALQALRDIAHEAEGQEVLVNGASGGVGVMAVQIGVRLGGRVTAVCSARNHALVQKLGATDVIDYHDADFTRADRAWDVVFDCAGRSSFRACARVLRPHGCYITTMPGLGHLLRQALNPLLDKQAQTIVVKPNRAELEELAGWVEDGSLVPIVQEVFPFEEVAAAQELSRKGGVQGKLVLTIDR